MVTRLRVKCSNGGHWNRVPVNKVFIEQNTSEPKVKAYIPIYKPLRVSNCEKCGKVVAEPKELIKIHRRTNAEVPKILEGFRNIEIVVTIVYNYQT